MALRHRISGMVDRAVADQLANRLGVVQAELDAKTAEAETFRLCAVRLEAEMGRWKAYALNAGCHDNIPCSSCGQNDWEPAVDNTGAHYLGCSHCTVEL